MLSKLAQITELASNTKERQVEMDAMTICLPSQGDQVLPRRVDTAERLEAKQSIHLITHTHSSSALTLETVAQYASPLESLQGAQFILYGGQ